MAIAAAFFFGVFGLGLLLVAAALYRKRSKKSELECSSTSAACDRSLYYEATILDRTAPRGSGNDVATTVDPHALDHSEPTYEVVVYSINNSHESLPRALPLQPPRIREL